MTLSEVDRDHGQAAFGQLIRDHGFEEQWEIKPVIKLASAFKRLSHI